MTITTRVAIAAAAGTVVALKLAAPSNLTEALAAADDPKAAGLKIAIVSTAAAVAVFAILS